MRDRVFIFSFTFPSGYKYTPQLEHHWENGGLTTAELLHVTRYTLGPVHTSLSRKGHHVLKGGKVTTIILFETMHEFF